ncbi:MAG: hypothetical protein ACTSYW_10530 [Candidatus Heimdallarchaeota archaeon]
MAEYTKDQLVKANFQIANARIPSTVKNVSIGQLNQPGILTLLADVKYIGSEVTTVSGNIIKNLGIEESARAYTAIVGPTNEYDFNTIQGAIDYLDDLGIGGTIYVKNGTYYPSGNITCRNDIKIKGESTENTIIHFNNGSYGIDIIGSDANNRKRRIYFEDLTIRNSNRSVTNGGAVKIEYAYFIFLNNVRFSHNTLDLYMNEVDNIYVRNCEFYDGDFMWYFKKFNHSGVFENNYSTGYTPGYLPGISTYYPIFSDNCERVEFANNIIKDTHYALWCGTYVNCTFFNNYLARQDGSMFQNTTLISLDLTKCDFVNNYVYAGNAYDADGSALSIDGSYNKITENYVKTFSVNIRATKAINIFQGNYNIISNNYADSQSSKDSNEAIVINGNNCIVEGNIAISQSEEAIKNNGDNNVIEANIAIIVYRKNNFAKANIS